MLLFLLPSLALAAPATAIENGESLITLLIAYVIAIVLAMVEIFLVPGFGMFGVAAVCSLAFCGYQAVAGYGIATGGLITLVLFVLAVIIVVVSIKIMIRTDAGKSIVLDANISSTATDNDEKYDPDLWIGREMKATTDLRPAGNARFEDKTHQVYTEGVFLHSGDKVRVFKVKEQKLFVELIESDKTEDK
jgi:membrane-bound serine protease (ClpP class)